jgi:hypothetical protein
MKLSTSVELNAAPLRAWRLLVDCNMCEDAPRGFYYFLGIPRPVSCRIGGSNFWKHPTFRECHFDGGSVLQSIDSWQPTIHLRISVLGGMRKGGGTPCFLKFIESLTDDFDIKEVISPDVSSRRVHVTRTTTLKLKWCAFPLYPSYYAALKLIHLDVFEAWKKMLGREPV